MPGTVSEGPSVALSFANNFWGKDDAGVDPLLQRMHNAKQTCDELKSFYQARASLEDDYARKLLNLSRKALGSQETGSLRTSLDVLRGEVEQMGKSHQNIAGQMKTELEEPLAAFAGAMKERRKIVQNGIEKLLKVKVQQTNQVNKTRDKYEQECLKIKGYLAQGHMVMGQEERKNKAKLEKTQINLATSNTEYENAVKILEETTGRWNRDWKAAADKFQDLEEERLDFMKSSLWSYANIASTVCVSDDASCEKVRLSLENCEVEKDIISFIKEQGTGQEIPDPPKYINFCRGDASDTQSETSDDDNYSVAQFQRTINPAYRSSSPQPSTYESHHDPKSTLVQGLGHDPGTPPSREATLTPQKAMPDRTRQPQKVYQAPTVQEDQSRQSQLDYQPPAAREAPINQHRPAPERTRQSQIGYQTPTVRDASLAQPQSRISSDRNRQSQVDYQAPIVRDASLVQSQPRISSDRNRQSQIDYQAPTVREASMAQPQPRITPDRNRQSQIDYQAPTVREASMAQPQPRIIPDRNRQSQIDYQAPTVREASLVQPQPKITPDRNRQSQIDYQAPTVREASVAQAQPRIFSDRNSQSQIDNQAPTVREASVVQPQPRITPDRNRQSQIDYQAPTVREASVAQAQPRISTDRNKQPQLDYQAQPSRRLFEQAQHGPLAAVPHDPYPMDGMTMLCRTGPPSERSSAHSAIRPSSRDSQSEYSNPTSFSSQEPPSGKISPMKQVEPPAEKQILKKKSGFFQSRSPFRRKSNKERDGTPMNPPNRNTWSASRTTNTQNNSSRQSHYRQDSQKMMISDRPSASPEPVDPRANFQLNVGNNVFDVETPGKKAKADQEQEQEELDPIAQALAELKGVTKASSTRVSADNYHGIPTPAPGAKPNSQPSGTQIANGSLMAGMRGTPPPSYDQPVQMLGLPQPAFTSKAMQQTRQKYEDQTRNMFSSSQGRPDSQGGYASGSQSQSRPGTRGSDMPRAVSPAPTRSASPRPGMQVDTMQGYRSASPNPYGGSPSQRARPQSASPARRGSDLSYNNHASPNELVRAASPAPFHDQERPNSSYTSNDMSVQLAPVQSDGYGSQGRAASRQGGSSSSRAMSYYGGSQHGSQSGSVARQRSKSLADVRQYNREGRPILNFARAMYMYQAAIPEELSFAKGDILAVLRLQDDGWWEAEVAGKYGRPGLVPSNYLQNC